MAPRLASASVGRPAALVMAPALVTRSVHRRWAVWLVSSTLAGGPTKLAYPTSLVRPRGD